MDKLSVGDLYKTVLPKGLIHELRRLVKVRREQAAQQETAYTKPETNKPINKRIPLKKGQMTVADFNALASVVRNGVLMKDGSSVAADEVFQVVDNDLYDEIEEEDDGRSEILAEDAEDADDDDDDDEDVEKPAATEKIVRGDGIVDEEAEDESTVEHKTESTKPSDADGFVSDQPATIIEVKAPANPTGTAMKPTKRNLNFNDNLMTSSNNNNRNVNFSANYIDSHTLLDNLLQNYFG